MRSSGILILLALAGCATAPGYRPPEVSVPSVFRETRDTIVETPTTHTTVIGTGSWPELGDTILARLMHEILFGS